MDDTSAKATAVDADATEPQEHGNRLARNALGLAGNIGIALGSSASTASMALVLAALVAASSFASPIAILICGLPMLAIAAAFRRLNRWRVNCGATYAWGGRAISPYFGFIVGWITILAYVVGVVSISLPIGPYVVSLFGNSSSRPAEAIVGFVAVILVTIIAYLGIKLTAWTQRSSIRGSASWPSGAWSRCSATTRTRSRSAGAGSPGAAWAGSTGSSPPR
jgi:amino acid transporter